MPDLKPQALVELFRRAQLSQEQWTHRAHLTVAAVYLSQAAPEQVLPVLREEIQALNLAHGVLTTPTRGYHETLTRVWLSLVLVARERLEPGATVADIVDLCLKDKSLRPTSHYTKERLASWEARSGWLPPDLLPLAHDAGAWQLEAPKLWSVGQDQV